MSKQPSYEKGPFTIKVKDAETFRIICEAFDEGKVWILSGTAGRPLCASNLSAGGVCPVTDETADRIWIQFMQDNVDHPVYDVLSVDDNGTITVQLEPEYESYRDDTIFAFEQRNRDAGI